MKYFLCFGFEGNTKRELEKNHVTLIYLGAENGWVIQDIIDDVDFYMLQHRHYLEPFQVKFSKREMFGVDKNIPVLLPDHTQRYIDYCFMKQLREQLERFETHGNERFPFNPHLTTDFHYFEGTVNKLFLCANNYEVKKEWSL